MNTFSMFFFRENEIDISCEDSHGTKSLIFFERYTVWSKISVILRVNGVEDLVSLLGQII